MALSTMPNMPTRIELELQGKNGIVYNAEYADTHRIVQYQTCHLLLQFNLRTTPIAIYEL